MKFDRAFASKTASLRPIEKFTPYCLERIGRFFHPRRKPTEDNFFFVDVFYDIVRNDFTRRKIVRRNFFIRTASVEDWRYRFQRFLTG